MDLLGIEIDDETLVPGLAVSSSRSQPLAGWYYFFHVLGTYCQSISRHYIRGYDIYWFQHFMKLKLLNFTSILSDDPV